MYFVYENKHYYIITIINISACISITREGISENDSTYLATRTGILVINYDG